MSYKKRIKPNVVYWNNIPAPYMVERFNAVAKRGNIEFEAWFSRRTDPDRSWDIDESKWLFKYKYMPSIKIKGKCLSLPIHVLHRNKPDLLVSLYAEPSFVIGWCIAKLRRIKTAFWVEVTFDRWVKRYRWKEVLRKWMFTGVDAILTVAKDGHDFAVRRGAKEGKVLYVPHVVDTEYFINEHKFYCDSKDEICSKLDLKGITFICVGRLWKGKGLDYLLDAFKIVQASSSEEVSLMLVGDGQDESYFRKRCIDESIKNVILTGFIQKDELPRYYAAADVFVFSTLGDPYGLVVDEAMASSLPIISTDAAGEISERIDEEINGYIVPVEDSVAMAKCMSEFIKDPMLGEKMGKASMKKIKGHTPDKWAKDFEVAIAKIVHSDGGM